MAEIYDEKSIQTLSGLEHIRKRPGMYIGRLGDGSHPDDGIYVLLKEVIDNSIDEFIMGAGKRVEVAISDDGTVSVRDYGRGIPLESVVACVSVMNTGGKYQEGAFARSIGMNGVGTKAVNALSDYFEVKSVREGKFVSARFAFGVLQGTEKGTTDERNGTFTSFHPDPAQFKNFAFKNEYVEKRLWMYAYLNSGLTLLYRNQRYYSAKGLEDLLNVETGDDRIYDIIYHRSEKPEISIEFAVTHSDNYGENCFSFVNGQYTNDGGTHLSAFKEGLLKAINEFSGKNFKADAVRDGMVGAIAIRIPDPVFEAQTKNKLGSTDVRGPIVNAVREAIVDFLHKNLDVAEVILDKVQRNESVHRKMQEAKKLGKESAAKSRLRNPKLKDCKYHVGEKWPRGEEPRETMIFLTEGDSAAGSIEQSRRTENQAVFALRGKPLNCFGATREELYKNEEFYFLTQALGIEDDIENLRYDKVIIATDADVDGMHIRNLLITFFLTFFEQLVLKGHLYVLETPLFRVRDPKAATREKKKAKKSPEPKKTTAESPEKSPEAPLEYFCYSEAERDVAAAKLGAKAEITRFKGLGEISPGEFQQFIGEDIKLLPVTLDSMRNVPELLKFYMGPNSPQRKEYIMTNLTVSKYE